MNETIVATIFAAAFAATAGMRLFGREARGRRIAAIIIGLLLVVAAAGRSFIRPYGAAPRTEVLIIDLSRSMGADAKRIARLGIEAWRPNAEADRSIVIACGVRAEVIHDGAGRPKAAPPSDAIEAPDFRAAFRPAAAFAALGRTIDRADRMHVTVFTDGGDSGAALDSIAGLPPLEALEVLPLAIEADDDIGVKFTSPPPVLADDERTALSVAVYGRIRGPQRRRIACGDDVREVILEPGAPPEHLTFEVKAPAADAEPFTVRILDRSDADPSNDVDRLAFTRRREGLRILVSADDPAAAARTAEKLRALGRFLVDVGDPKTLRSAGGADVLVVADVSAKDAPHVAALAALLAAHAHSGGGVLFAGADRAFGRGAWAGTDFDRLSPLKAEPGRPPLDLYACIDRSGSMEAGGRLDLARRAVRALYEKLLPGDRLICLAFGVDIRATTLVRGTDDPAKLGALDGLAPEGGTHVGGVIDRALADAAAEDRSSAALLLTDGRSDAGDLTGERIDRWIALANARKRPFHVFWFDRDESLRAPLDRLAKGTNGSLVPVDDFRTLLEPFMRAASADPLIENAAVTLRDGRRTAISKVLRTHSEDGADLLARVDRDTAALAVIARGAGRAAAAPVAADEVERLFADPAAFAAFLESLAAGRSRLSAAIGAERDGTSWRFIVRVQDPLAPAPSGLEYAGRKYPLERIGVAAFRSAPLDFPPPAGEAVLTDSRGLRAPLAFAGADTSDREPAGSAPRRSDLAARLERALAAIPPAAARRLDLLTALLFAFLVADVILRANGRRS